MNTDLFRKCCNFRQLGGYKTRDGRIIKDGLFYRSGALAMMDEQELQAVENLHIQTIIDFRSEEEVRNRPDPDIPGAAYYHMSALTDEKGREIDLSPAGMEHATPAQFFSDAYQNQFLLNFYGRMPFSPAYRFLFKKIREDQVPVLIHCTAGKDRTGVGAMLILLALGVEEETILQDYMLTNIYRRQFIDELLQSKKDTIALYPAAKKVYMGYEGVIEESLRCSMQQIKQKYITYENYFKQVLNLDENDLNELRRRYTR